MAAETVICGSHMFMIKELSWALCRVQRGSRVVQHSAPGAFQQLLPQMKVSCQFLLALGFLGWMVCVLVHSDLKTGIIDTAICSVLLFSVFLGHVEWHWIKLNWICRIEFNNTKYSKWYQCPIYIRTFNPGLFFFILSDHTSLLILVFIMKCVWFIMI